MAALTDTLGFDKGTAAHPAKGQTRVSYVEVVMDFAAITVARAAAGAAALGSDSLQVISVPANTLVLACGATTEVVEGATATFDIGTTGTDVDGFVDGGDANALGTTESNGAFLNGDNNSKYFATADTIDILLAISGSTLDAAKIKVWAVLVDCSSTNLSG